MNVQNVFTAISPGDTVTIALPDGQQRCGRCVMKFDDRAVLNLGGKHGTPGIAHRDNTVAVKKLRERRPI